MDQLDSLAVTLEQRIRAALARPLPFGIDLAEEQAGTPSIISGQDADDAGRRGSAPLGEATGPRETLTPGEPRTFLVGPLLGVRRLSALEQQLAGRLGAAQVELRMYRDGEASFRLRLADEVPVGDLVAAVTAAGGRVAACALEDDRRTLRVRLAPDEGTAP